MIRVYGLFSLVRAAVAMDANTQDLVTPMKQYGEACGYEVCSQPVKGMLNIHIVPHSHGELGSVRTFNEYYTGITDLVDQSKVNMKAILDFTISELWADPARTFALSDLPYFFHWWAHRDETVRRMVYQLIRQGRLQLVGGGWSMTDESTASYHAVIDQFTYSLRKINATFLDCARPLVSWQVDSFGHTKEFASLMALMGFDGHFINPISYDDELRRMQEKGLEMLWRGSDDLGVETDIFTHKLFDGYWSPPGFCFGSFCSDPRLTYRNRNERTDQFIESMRTRQGPYYATEHLLVVMGKKLAYYDAAIWFENIDKLMAHVNVRSADRKQPIRAFYSSPACYLKAVHNSKPVVPIKQDDFVPITYDVVTRLSGHFTSRPTIKYMVREGHVLLQMAKQLQVLARLPPNSHIFEEFNWIMGVFQDHNILSGSMKRHVKDFYTQKMYMAVQRSTLIFKQAFNKLRLSSNDTKYFRCSFNTSSCSLTNGINYLVVVYNPLAWPVSKPIRLPVSLHKFTVTQPNLQKVKSVIMKIPDAVLQLPNRYKNNTYELVFIADLPALGYKSYYIEKKPPEHLKHLLYKPKTYKQKRSIIKKINKNKNKKYLIRQASRNIDDQMLLDNDDPSYDYDEPNNTQTEFGNVTNDYVDDTTTVDEILTASPKTETILESVEEEVTVYEEESSTTENVETTTVADRESEMYMTSDDTYISNKYINISLDNTQQVSGIILLNGVKIALKIRFFYFVSDDPVRMGRAEEKRPGAYTFRPMDPKPIQIKDFIKVEVHKTDIVEELHTKYADYASFTLKLYTEHPVIEFDWVIGPIPTQDELGKDVFVRYETDLGNNGVFYTDSNGRQTMKRIKNSRGDYVSVNEYDIAGNYYPVTSKIYIEDLDKDIRFSIFNDRAQGGTSLDEGQIDLMVHRRILTDDGGIGTFLNDTENGEGIIVRGKHYLYVAKADYKPHKIFEKKFAKEIELAPQTLVSHSDPRVPLWYIKSYDDWLKCKNVFSGVKKKLPIGIHLLTLEEWHEGTILVRLENYLEKADTVKDGIKIVFIKDLFTNIRVRDVKETTLAANLWLKDWVPLEWSKKTEFYDNFNDFYGGNSRELSNATLKAFDEVNIDTGIKLSPLQIRTFVVWFDYI